MQVPNVICFGRDRHHRVTFDVRITHEEVRTTRRVTIADDAVDVTRLILQIADGLTDVTDLEKPWGKIRMHTVDRGEMVVGSFEITDTEIWIEDLRIEVLGWGVDGSSQSLNRRDLENAVVRVLQDQR